MNGNININNETLEYIKNYEFTPQKGIKFTSIILLTYNKLEYTQLCIESIRKFTPEGDYEIIIVDNNSTDGTVEWLKIQDDLRVIYNSTNKGFTTGCNQGMEIAIGETILLLNNDTIVTPNWLNNLDKALYSSDDIGAVGAITNYAVNLQKISVKYTDISQMIDFAEGINKSDPKLWQYKMWLVGFCYLIKKEALNKVGLLDERFSPGNYEDNDWSLRILCEGHKLLLCKDAFIHHFGSISFKINNDTLINTVYTNYMKISQKWGFDIELTNKVRWDLISKIKATENQEINILEIGCETGATLLAIKDIYRNANIYGIETCKEAANIAKAFAHMININIDCDELPYEPNIFDYVIISKPIVNEDDRLKVFEIIKKYLKDDGYIIK